MGTMFGASFMVVRFDFCVLKCTLNLTWRSQLKEEKNGKRQIWTYQAAR
jgi:hypothetical protein